MRREGCCDFPVSGSSFLSISEIWGRLVSGPQGSEEALRV